MQRGAMRPVFLTDRLCEEISNVSNGLTLKSAGGRGSKSQLMESSGVDFGTTGARGLNADMGAEVCMACTLA